MYDIGTPTFIGIKTMGTQMKYKLEYLERISFQKN